MKQIIKQAKSKKGKFLLQLIITNSGQFEINDYTNGNLQSIRSYHSSVSLDDAIMHFNNIIKFFHQYDNINLISF